MLQGATIAAKTFESEVSAKVAGAAAQQSRRDATPLLNTPAHKTDRYANLTKLEPQTAPRRKASDSGKWRAQHAQWHESQSLKPDIMDLWTRDRESEFIDTNLDPDETYGPHVDAPDLTKPEEIQKIAASYDPAVDETGVCSLEEVHYKDYDLPLPINSQMTLGQWYDEYMEAKAKRYLAVLDLGLHVLLHPAKRCPSARAAQQVNLAVKARSRSCPPAAAPFFFLYMIWPGFVPLGYAM